jgi:hypothetical protein
VAQVAVDRRGRQATLTCQVAGEFRQQPIHRRPWRGRGGRRGGAQAAEITQHRGHCQGRDQLAVPGGSPRPQVLLDHNRGQPITGTAPALQPATQIGHQPHLAADHLRVIAPCGQMLAEPVGIRCQRAADLCPGRMTSALPALHGRLLDVIDKARMTQRNGSVTLRERLIIMPITQGMTGQSASNFQHNSGISGCSA